MLVDKIVMLGLVHGLLARPMLVRLMKKPVCYIPKIYIKCS